MEKQPQTAETYDAMYAAGGFSEAYLQPYRTSQYYPMFLAVYRALRREGGGDILEVGCGNGQLARLLLDRSDWPYRGFDFSDVAVRMAREVTGLGDRIRVADAMSAASYAHAYDTIVCTEVLEHLPDDRGAIAHWRPGALCICSVPNFDSPYHERYFDDEQAVRARYGDLIAIDSIQRVRKPYLGDRSWRNRLRQAIWSRYRPARLMMVLGLRSFAGGGWFVFTGRRR